VNDINADLDIFQDGNIEWVDKEFIYSEADVISLHVPLTGQTKNMIRQKELLQMKHDALIINTARGGIINEDDLLEVLMGGRLGGVAIDVFNREPYDGELANIERCLLTSHMGSMTIDCRNRMEIEATEEVIRFLSGYPLKSLVPAQEYDAQHREQ
jgi:D-3-phosphoglycerate dehydrogenase